MKTLRLAAVVLASMAAFAQTGMQIQGVSMHANTLNLDSTPMVANPSFSPPVPYTGPATSVTLTVTTSGATILYTTNGATPACPSTGNLYTAPVNVAATTTVKAIGCKAGWLPSAVKAGLFTISGTFYLYYGYGCGPGANTCTAGGNSNENATVFGAKVTTGVNAAGYTGVTIGVYFAAKTAGTHFKAALYDQGWGTGGVSSPIANCAQTTAQAIGGVPGWTEIALPAGCTLSASTSYYVVFVSESSSDTFAYDTGGPSDSNGHTTDFNYGTAFSSNISTASSSALLSAFLKVTAN